MKKPLLSICLSTGSYPDFMARLLALAGAGSSYVCVANVHMVVEAHRDPAFAAVVNGADLITPDGMPLTWGLRLLHGIRQDRVAGMDLLPDLLREAERQAVAVYFYGGTEAMLARTAAHIKDHYPNLRVAGMHSPPFRVLTPDEEQAVVSTINASGARFVFVALGCPKQEKWMAAMKGRVQACMIGIGGALPVVAGMQKRAPALMQKAGVEWIYRLAQEPRRLFKRYAVTNPVFVGLLLKAWLTGK